MHYPCEIYQLHQLCPSDSFVYLSAMHSIPSYQSPYKLVYHLLKCSVSTFHQAEQSHLRESIEKGFWIWGGQYPG